MLRIPPSNGKCSGWAVWHCNDVVPTGYCGHHQEKPSAIPLLVQGRVRRAMGQGKWTAASLSCNAALPRDPGWLSCCWACLAPQKTELSFVVSHCKCLLRPHGQSSGHHVQPIPDHVIMLKLYQIMLPCSTHTRSCHHVNPYQIMLSCPGQHSVSPRLSSTWMS